MFLQLMNAGIFRKDANVPLYGKSYVEFFNKVINIHDKNMLNLFLTVLIWNANGLYQHRQKISYFYIKKTHKYCFGM